MTSGETITFKVAWRTEIHCVLGYWFLLSYVGLFTVFRSTMSTNEKEFIQRN